MTCFTAPRSRRSRKSSVPSSPVAGITTAPSLKAPSRAAHSGASFPSMIKMRSPRCTPQPRRKFATRFDHSDISAKLCRPSSPFSSQIQKGRPLVAARHRVEIINRPVEAVEPGPAKIAIGSLASRRDLPAGNRGPAGNPSSTRPSSIQLRLPPGPNRLPAGWNPSSARAGSETTDRSRWPPAEAGRTRPDRGTRGPNVEEAISVPYALYLVDAVERAANPAVMGLDRHGAAFGGVIHHVYESRASDREYRPPASPNRMPCSSPRSGSSRATDRTSDSPGSRV